MVVLVLDVPIVKICAMVAAISILFVLFMIAPLGSIYVFLISIHHPDHSSTTSEETAALIMDLLQKNGMADGSTNGTTTAAIDELWSTVIANPALAELLTQRTLQHHVRLVTPWLVTFVLAAAIIMVVCTVMTITARQPQLRRQERIRKIVATALDGQVVEQTTTNDDDDRGNNSSGNNVCGICLEGFADDHDPHDEGGDTNNTSNSNTHPNDNNGDNDRLAAVHGMHCRHTFHEPCVAHWLCRRSSQFQCPLCRRDFLDAAITRKLRRLTVSSS